jgi:hypothetical protein
VLELSAGNDGDDEQRADDVILSVIHCSWVIVDAVWRDSCDCVQSRAGLHGPACSCAPGCSSDAVRSVEPVDSHQVGWEVAPFTCLQPRLETPRRTCQGYASCLKYRMTQQLHSISKLFLIITVSQLGLIVRDAKFTVTSLKSGDIKRANQSFVGPTHPHHHVRVRPARASSRA